MARAVSLQAAAVSLVRQSRTSGAPCACFPSALEKPNSLSIWGRIHQVCPVAHLYSIGVHLVGSHLRLHSHSGGQGSTGPCLQPMSLATLLWPEGLQQPSLSVLTESEKTVSFTKHTINRLSKDACLGEDEPQHYAFILVAKGLQSCRLYLLFGSSGHCGRDRRVLLHGAVTIWHTSRRQSLHNEMPNSCPGVVRDHNRGNTRSPLVMTISLRDLGSRIRCRSYFLECARTGSEGLLL